MRRNAVLILATLWLSACLSGWLVQFRAMVHAVLGLG